MDIVYLLKLEFLVRGVSVSQELYKNNYGQFRRSKNSTGAELRSKHRSWTFAFRSRIYQCKVNV